MLVLLKQLVLDASVATKWHLIGEEHTDKARLILDYQGRLGSHSNGTIPMRSLVLANGCIPDGGAR
ncbi:MAG: hypothetical protein M1396_04955 [Chloroflexi bacterium]|nr:hypothetical protein [Chloroflexota bacterium]